MDEASDDFVVSSNGLRLKPKVVQVYEDVILKVTEQSNKEKKKRWRNGVGGRVVELG